MSLSFSHARMPPGVCSGQEISQRTNAGTLALVHAYSSTENPIAVELMHTRMTLDTYAHAHSNFARECSCQAGPGQTKFQNAHARPPWVTGIPLIASFSVTRGSSFRHSCARTTRAHACSLRCCLLCGPMAYAQTTAARGRHSRQDVDTRGSGTLALDRPGSRTNN